MELTYQEHMDAKARKKFYMEEVGKITSEATQLIIDRLQELGVITNGDEFFDPIFRKLEQHCPNDYRSHM